MPKQPDSIIINKHRPLARKLMRVASLIERMLASDSSDADNVNVRMLLKNFVKTYIPPLHIMTSPMSILFCRLILPPLPLLMCPFINKMPSMPS